MDRCWKFPWWPPLAMANFKQVQNLSLKKDCLKKLCLPPGMKWKFVEISERPWFKVANITSGQSGRERVIFLGCKRVDISINIIGVWELKFQRVTIWVRPSFCGLHCKHCRQCFTHHWDHRENTWKILMYLKWNATGFWWLLLVKVVRIGVRIAFSDWLCDLSVSVNKSVFNKLHHRHHIWCVF